MIKSEEIVELVFEIVRTNLSKREYKIISENLVYQTIEGRFLDIEEIFKIVISTDLKGITLPVSFHSETLSDSKTKLIADLKFCESLINENF